MTGEHIRIDGGKLTGEPGHCYFVSVWLDGAYLIVDDAAFHEAAKMKARETSREWGNIPIVDEVA